VQDTKKEWQLLAARQKERRENDAESPRHGMRFEKKGAITDCEKHRKKKRQRRKPGGER